MTTIDDLQKLIEHKRQALPNRAALSGMREQIQELMSKRRLGAEPSLLSDVETVPPPLPLPWQGTIPPLAIEALEHLCERGTCPAWWRTHDELMRRLGDGMLVGLVGNFGAGKTVLAAALKREAWRRGKRGRYTTARKMFRGLRGTFDRHKEADAPREGDVIDEFANLDLLIIDEAQERGNTDYEDRSLVEIIGVRQGHNRDTVLISNLTPVEFAAAMGGGVVDRIRQSGVIIECDWPSFRGAPPLRLSKDEHAA